jgi:hypothetical protein
MKIRPVGAELFHADGLTGRQTRRSFAVFRTRLQTFKNGYKNVNCLQLNEQEAEG